jgi:uncharacterized protein
MKKTIIILGLALMTFANVAEAKNQTTFSTSKEIANYNSTPLCAAIIKGDLEAVKKFVEYGTDINEVSDNGLTPLMFAARYNKIEILKFLVQNGADKKKKDEKGFTALKYAELSKAQEAIDYLNS